MSNTTSLQLNLTELCQATSLGSDTLIEITSATRVAPSYTQQ